MDARSRLRSRARPQPRSQGRFQNRSQSRSQARHRLLEAIHPLAFAILGIFAIISAILLGYFFRPQCAPCPRPPPCPRPQPCPLVPAGGNFSWIEYIPRITPGKLQKSLPRDKHIPPAWHVFNVSDASVSWANPLLPTDEESVTCRRRINRQARQLRALWHPDRASQSGLRTLLDLSDRQLIVVDQIIQQAYNDAMFGCMTAAQKSTWVNALTDKQSVDEWDAVDADDIMNMMPTTDEAEDPRDPGLDLSTAEFIHVRQCMERQGIVWAQALYQLRLQRRGLWERCKSSIEQAVTKLVGPDRKPFWEELAHKRALRRQQVVAALMKRTGVLNGCQTEDDDDDDDDDFGTAWWERRDFDQNLCDVGRVL
ncbi:uncharacterized protein IWZ02DRAFT_437853 [Phyllosticta citriasiana]|uniref:uncharacterized protein n=1 Tax=Phyllosticta citriasiana TaxID=595635 RepID=UPI0030FDDAC8